MKVLIIHTSYKQKGGEDSVLANETALLQSRGLSTASLNFSNEEGTFFKFFQLPFNYGAFRKTLKVVDEFQPDLAHIHNLHFAGTAAVLYALKKRKVKVIMTLHNYRLLCPSGTLFNRGRIFTGSLRSVFPWKAVYYKAYHNSWFFSLWSAFSMMLHQRLGTWSIPAKYIVLGQHTKELFAQSKLKAIVPRMSVKPNFCPPCPSGEQPREYYLYLGRLSEEKGITMALKAFAQNGLLLKVAGAGPLENLVAEASLDHRNIQFLGSVMPAEASKLLKGAKALIFPSQWYEPFGMVIIEAFAAGTPVIASRLGQLEFTVDEQVNGLHFDPGDLSDLNEKLLYYDQLPPEAKQRYQANAKLTHQRAFAPEDNYRQLIELYHEVTGREPTSERSDRQELYTLKD